ncbi:hypothetical protein F511_33140 [Dorcoceras hygrometricum]|uniref:Uncharacterized protein n=1 Tax=Dorcoceras hygrometricum TaxID=472368 RepID=A0A2Z7CYM9_9LAMI|nr:hypothetical protein F511_33140 [Dorcoceras hygrometricum]
MMKSRRICPADGSQYKDSAVGLVFMESAAGLSLETSKVESVVRNQAEAKLNKLEHNKPAGTMTTSCKRQREKMNQLIQQEDFVLITSRKIPAGSICLIPAGQPDASNSSIQSRKLQYYASSRKDPDARKEEVAKRRIQSQAEASSRKVSSR